MDGAQVSVFKQSNQISFSGFLESQHSRRLESQIILEFRGNFSDESLEGEFPDEEFSALLEPSDFSESNCSRSEPVGFLDSAANARSAGSGFLGLLVSNVFSGGFATGVLSCGLLCSCHLGLWMF